MRELRELLVMIAVVLGILALVSIWGAVMEARAYNAVTGSNVTWQQALFIDLRVEASPR